MISVRDYDELLQRIGGEYCVADIRYVPRLAAWAEQHGESLDEPAQFMKLTAGPDGQLVMVVQEAVDDGRLHDLITALDVRWQVVDNRANLMLQFDTAEKQLAYVFLREYARTKGYVAEDERVEDEWALDQMKRLGFPIQRYEPTV
ncbi:MAG: hypothetical protein AB1805_05765 [Nitrospirota bacterium]